MGCRGPQAWTPLPTSVAVGPHLEQVWSWCDGKGFWKVTGFLVSRTPAEPRLSWSLPEDWRSCVLSSLSPGPGHLLPRSEDLGELPVEKEVEMGAYRTPIEGAPLTPCPPGRPAPLLCPEGCESLPSEAAETGCSPWQKRMGMEVSRSLCLHTTRIFLGFLESPSPHPDGIERDAFSGALASSRVCLLARSPDVSVWSACLFEVLSPMPCESPNS